MSRAVSKTVRFRVHRTDQFDRFGGSGWRRTRYMVVDVMTGALADDDEHTNRKIAAGIAADYNRAWREQGKPDATQPFEMPY